MKTTILTISCLLLATLSFAQSKKKEVKTEIKQTLPTWSMPFNDNDLVFINNEALKCDSILENSSLPAKDENRVKNYIEVMRQQFLNTRNQQQKALVDSAAKKNGK